MSDLVLPDTTAVTGSTAVDLDVLDEIQQRVLWLAVRMVDSDQPPATRVIRAPHRHKPVPASRPW